MSSENYPLPFKNWPPILVDDLIAAKEDMASWEKHSLAFKNWLPILVDGLIAAK